LSLQFWSLEQRTLNRHLLAEQVLHKSRRADEEASEAATDQRDGRPPGNEA
jgi:hypothetical protein